MSDIELTEKDISRAYKRLKYKKGWIKVVDIKSGNKPASHYRRLMKLMVDRGLAFDNQINPESEQYQICFNLAEKDRILEELGDSIKHNRFDDSVLSDPIMKDLPPLALLDQVTTRREMVYFDILRAESVEVHKAFCIYQNGNKIEDGNYYFYCNPLIGLEKEKYNKHDKSTFCIKIHKFINIYKAIKVGWEEIKDTYLFETYNDLFLAMLDAYYYVNFVNLVSSDVIQRKYSSERRKLSKILGFSKILRDEIERLSESQDISSKDHYKLLLEEYDRDPHGRGLDNAVRSLIKVAKQGTKKNHILDKLEDFYKSFSMIGGFPNFNTFEDFLEYPDEPQEFQYSDDPQLDGLTKLYQGYWIKDTLRNSANPRVRKAVFEWDKSIKKYLAVDQTRSRRMADSLGTRP